MKIKEKLMRDARIKVTVRNQPHDKTAMVWCQVAAVVAMLFFAIGQSIAQEPASSDVYVAPQRFYAQKLVEDVKAKHPEVIYLNLRTIPPDRTESFKVA